MSYGGDIELSCSYAKKRGATCSRYVAFIYYRGLIKGTLVNQSRSEIPENGAGATEIEAIHVHSVLAVSSLKKNRSHTASSTASSVQVPALNPLRLQFSL